MPEPCTRALNQLIDGYCGYLEARFRDAELLSDYLERGAHASEVCGHGPFAYEGEETTDPGCTAATSALMVVHALMMTNKEQLHSQYELMLASWTRYRDGKCPPEER